MELFNVLNRKNKVNSNKNIFKNRSEIHFKVKAKKLFYSRPALYLLNTKGISWGWRKMITAIWIYRMKNYK